MVQGLDATENNDFEEDAFVEEKDDKLDLDNIM